MKRKSFSKVARKIPSFRPHLPAVLVITMDREWKRSNEMLKKFWQKWLMLLSRAEANDQMLLHLRSGTNMT